MNKLKVSVLVACLLMSFTASAKIVFDPTNFVVNKLSAVKSIAMEIQAVKQTLFELEQLKTMQTNLKNIGKNVTGAVLSELDVQISDTKKYNEALLDVSKSLGGEADYLSSLKTNYVLGGKGDFNDFLKSLDNRAKSGDANAARLMKQADVVISNTEKSMKRRTELQKMVSKNEGIMQAAQTTNQYLDLIASQNSDLTTMLAENSRELAEQKKKEAINVEYAKKAAEEDAKNSEKSKKDFVNRWTSTGAVTY